MPSTQFSRMAAVLFGVLACRTVSAGSNSTSSNATTFLGGGLAHVDMRVGFSTEAAAEGVDSEYIDMVCYPAPSACSVGTAATIVHRIKKNGDAEHNVGTEVKTMTYPTSDVADVYNLGNCEGPERSTPAAAAAAAFAAAGAEAGRRRTLSSGEQYVAAEESFGLFPRMVFGRSCFAVVYRRMP